MLWPFLSWWCFAGVFVAGVAHAANDLPLFDAHIHYSADAYKTYTPEKIVEILDRAGVERALVSSTPNDGTIALHRKFPARIVAGLRPYRKQGDLESWYRDPDVVPFLEQELRRGIYRAIGEFHLHSGQTDTPVVKRVVALAANATSRCTCIPTPARFGNYLALTRK